MNDCNLLIFNSVLTITTAFFAIYLLLKKTMKFLITTEIIASISFFIGVVIILLSKSYSAFYILGFIFTIIPSIILPLIIVAIIIKFIKDRFKK